MGKGGRMCSDERGLTVYKYNTIKFDRAGEISHFIFAVTIAFAKNVAVGLFLPSGGSMGQ